MKKLYFFLIVCLLHSNLFGQPNYNNYQPIVSKGKPTDGFTMSTYQRYLKQISQITKEDKKKLKGDRFSYAFINSYSQDVIFNSGFVAYNDPVSKYAHKVLDIILENDKELRKKLNVYLLKSTAVNAFTTNEGSIFISVGLLAQLQSEAQLAFVLAHEAIHFASKHHMGDYVMLRDAIKNSYRKKNHEETVESLFAYSKKHEIEADSEAFKKYYKNSKYSKKEIESLFDVLLYSYLPFDEVKFDIGIFETENYKFPSKYSLTTYNEITAIENYDDSKSTHPNILKRRENILELLENEERGGENYIVSEKTFLEVQKNARFELCYLYQLKNSFEKAIYSSFLLLKDYPDNKYLETTIAQSLYGLSFYKNRDKYDNAHIPSSKIEGLSQQVNHIFDIMDEDEICLLALRYAWNLKYKYQQDQNMQQLTDSLLNESTWALSFNLSKLPLTLNANKKPKEQNIDISSLSKTEKIKYRKKANKSTINLDTYYKHALVDLPESEELVNKFKKIRTKDEDFYKELKHQKKSKVKRNYNNDFDNLKYGEGLEIKKIILLPSNYYQHLAGFSPSSVKELFQEKDKVSAKVKEIASKVNLEIISFDENTNNTDLQNDKALVATWLYEQNHQASVDYMPASQKYISILCEKYNTNYIGWIDIDFRKGGSYEMIVVDLKTKKPILYYNQVFTRPLFDFLKMNIYSSLNRLRSKSN